MFTLAGMAVQLRRNTHLGHKHKRGESLSYGLYSSGLAPHQYLEAVETMLASDYMSQFLKLFNK